MGDDYPQLERLVITWRSAYEVLVLQDIALISSWNVLTIFARLAKHTQTKLLAIQSPTVFNFHEICTTYNEID
jgi:hypothetical protein